MVRETNGGFSRRSFVKGAAFVGALTATGGIVACSPSGDSEVGGTNAADGSNEQVFLNSCHGNCNNNCAWDVIVRDGYIVNADPHTYDDDAEDLHRGGCMRGYLNIQRVYDADRLKYPMRRTNPKTEDEPQWEQITWDEAIDLIAEKWQTIIQDVGPTGIGFWRVYGTSAYLSGYASGVWPKLKTALGANTVVPGADMAWITIVNQSTGYSGASLDSLRQPQTFVFWSANVAETKWNVWRFANTAREDHGAKFYNIDPVSTITAIHSDKHIAIKPATDAVFAMALMKVIFDNGWEDNDFIQNSSSAPYLVKADGTCLRETDLGKDIAEDAKPQLIVWDTSTNSAKPINEVSDSKNMALTGTFEIDGLTVRTALDLLKERVSSYTLEECERLTGIPQETTLELAEVITSTETCFYHQNGFCHYKNSSQAILAVSALMIITGCLGKPGTGVLYNYAGGPVNADWASIPASTPGINIPDSRIQDVAEKGILDDVAVPMKSLFTFAGNILGSGADRKAIESALRNFEFVVVPEIRMTDTCKFADLILPVSHWWERDDIINANSTPYFRICEKAVDPPYECLSDYEVARRIAEKMGVGEYFQGSETDNLEQILNSEANIEKGCTYADLKEKKIVRTAEDGSFASPESFYMENARMNFFLDRPKPAANYGQMIDYNLWNLPAFIEDAEVLESSPLAEKYPLILFTPHTKYGTQTSFHHTKWLHEILTEPLVHVNPIDAQARDIAEGDYIRMFNDRGETVAKAKFNSGNMPGTMTLSHGWAKQYFKKGHYQELSSSSQSDDLSNNASFFDVRVQVEPWKEG